jgi:integrase
MSDLAPLLQSFFTDKLDRHLNASIHTKAAYADTFRLLLLYAQDATGVAPSRLSLADLKRTKTTLVSFLTIPEAEALIAAPDTRTWLGRRDRLLLHLGIQTGLRVSELVSLRISDIQIGPHSQLECVGKRAQAACHPSPEEPHDTPDRLVSRSPGHARDAFAPEPRRDAADQSRGRQARHAPLTAIDEQPPARYQASDALLAFLANR